MASVKPKQLHTYARQQLRQAATPYKKVVLLHTAIALGSSLLVMALNYYLSHRIADTGGLAGMGLRSVLTTLQSVLELGMFWALPFWEMGLLFCALRWAKGEDAGYGDLLQGFRRLGAVFGLQLLRGGVFFALGIALFYVCFSIFVMTPFGVPLMAFLEPIMDAASGLSPTDALMTPEQMMTAVELMVPLFIFFGAVYIVLAAVIFYRLRFAEFAVLEGSGAARAMLGSVRITGGNALQVVKLDLYFWWFYLLQAVAVAVSYADMLLPVNIGVGTFFLLSVVSALCQGVLLWQCRADVVTTLAVAYKDFSESQ